MYNLWNEDTHNDVINGTLVIAPGTPVKCGNDDHNSIFVTVSNGGTIVATHWQGSDEATQEKFNTLMDAYGIEMPSNEPTPNEDGFYYDTMGEMKSAISKEYQRAAQVVKKDYPFIRSEPYLLMLEDGERCSDPIYYSGALTKKLIDSLIAENDFNELWYNNGIDGAETMQDWEYSDYAPKVEYAELILWKKVNP